MRTGLSQCIHTANRYLGDRIICTIIFRCFKPTTNERGYLLQCKSRHSSEVVKIARLFLRVEQSGNLAGNIQRRIGVE